MTLTLALALGAHLMALAALAVLARGSTRARAYARFLAAVTLWILLELLHRLGILPVAAEPLSGVVAHFLSVLFLLDRALPVEPWRRGSRLALLVAALASLPFTLVESPWYTPAIEIAWFAGTWLLAAWRIRMTQMRREDGALTLRAECDTPGRQAVEDPELAWRRRLVALALVATPVAIGIMIAIGAVVAVPLLSAAVQAVVLYAMVRFSLYEVHTTASRSGALAADAAVLDRRAVAGEIAAMVAHEVRNPLTGVRSLAQQIAEDTVPEERRQRYASLIVREVDRVEGIVGALLSASAPQRGRDGMRDATPLVRLMEDIALLVGGRVRRSGLTLEIDAGPHVVAAPAEPLAQVLLNLVLNAIAQAPTGTAVGLHARANGTLAEVHVQDHGAGIAATSHERIWDPFYSETGGSGLGLAVVKRICDERGWLVEARDTPGGGATFVVTLPLVVASGHPA